MTVVVHISDTHFGTEVDVVVKAIQHSINQINPDIVILTGDITQRARSSQFKKAAEFMLSLTAKTKLAIPGNHDIPLFNLFMRLFMPYRLYNKWFGARAYIWKNEEVEIICYDATSPLRHTKGKLSAKEALGGINAAENRKPFLIACAHQPLATAWEEDIHETLINRDEAAIVWSENQVDLVLSGHVHVPIISTTEKVFPKLQRHFTLSGAGTAVSHRVRPGAPNSFNVIELQNNENKTINITQHVFNLETLQFVALQPEYFTYSNKKGWEERKME